MLEFLTSLILFVFGLGAVGQPPIDAFNVLSRAGEHFASSAEPQGSPVQSYQGDQETAGEHTDLPDQAAGPISGSSDNSTPSNENPEWEEQANGEHPNTQLTSAYNNSSGQVVGSVAQVAVENADPLESCEGNPDCDTSDEPPFIPDPLLPCVPPPPCLSSAPFCLLPEPQGGWCEPSEDTHPDPDPTPTGHPDKPPFECPPPPFPPYSLGPISPDVVVCIQ